MHQSFQYLIPLILTTTSAFVVTPSQAETPVESQNMSSISSELSTDVDKTVPDNSKDLSNSTNQKPNILSENSSNSSTSTAVTTTATTSNPRIPISSRIFAVPSMQQ